MEVLRRLLIVLSIQHVLGDRVSIPTMTILRPQGVRFTYPDSTGVSLVAFHYSINKPVVNVGAGDYNYDVTTKTDVGWVHENTHVVVKPGDEVHYWINVIQNGLGYLLTDQIWIVPVPTTSATTTTARPTSRHTQRPTVVTTDPIVNTQQPVSYTQASYQYQTNATTTAHSGLDSQQLGHSGIESGGTTGVVTDQGTTSTSCSCAGSSVRPLGSERSCSIYPCLIFVDEFNTLDLDIWEHEITAGGGGNWEFEYYTNNRSNSYVRDGKLFIKPTLTVDSLNNGPDSLTKGTLDIWGSQPGDLCTGNSFWGCRRDGTPDHIINPIQSARLRSSRGFNFRYGKLEIRAKMPKGDWLWPAIWMLPLRNAYGKWPASGEIDIVESRGNSEQYRDISGRPQGCNVASSTLHFGSDFWHNKWQRAHGEKFLSSGSFADGFHNYTLIWDEKFISILIDGDEVLNVTPPNTMWEYGGNDKEGVENPWRNGNKMAPFDQEFFLIMNVAVGGLGYFPDTNTYTVGKPWSDKSNFAMRDFWNNRGQWYPTWRPEVDNGEGAALQVDYIKVWKLKP